MDRFSTWLYVPKNPFTWAFGNLRNKGLSGTFNTVVRAVVDLGFDLRYGTETERWVEINTLGFESEHKNDGLPYGPTQIVPLRTVLRKLNLPKDGVFIDLGAGKGRVLLIAAQTGFQRIIGVEFSPELCAIARSNIKAFLRKTRITAQLEVVESDVAAFPIAREYNVFFMFHPFERIVLARLIDNLHSSQTQFPRKIWLICNNPIAEDDELIGDSSIFHAPLEFMPSGSSFPFKAYHN
jgi:SAM-dependent methyltransferase